MLLLGLARDVTLWILEIAAAMFFRAGGSKVAGATAMVGPFDTIGIGQWFRYVTGGLEVLGAAGLPVLRLPGAGVIELTRGDRVWEAASYNKHYDPRFRPKHLAGSRGQRGNARDLGDSPHASCCESFARALARCSRSRSSSHA